MPELEKLMEEIDLRKNAAADKEVKDKDAPVVKPPHFEFRLWLTTAPSEVFPSSILMRGIKMTYEPPRGLKNNLRRAL